MKIVIDLDDKDFYELYVLGFMFEKNIQNWIHEMAEEIRNQNKGEA